MPNFNDAVITEKVQPSRPVPARVNPAVVRMRELTGERDDLILLLDKAKVGTGRHTKLRQRLWDNAAEIETLMKGSKDGRTNVPSIT